LLVLDTLEQVLAAGQKVSELLAVAPRLKVLVTSRALLHMWRAQFWCAADLPDLRHQPPLGAIRGYVGGAVRRAGAGSQE
jgi:hypothetical protein